MCIGLNVKFRTYINKIVYKNFYEFYITGVKMSIMVGTCCLNVVYNIHLLRLMEIIGGSLFTRFRFNAT